MAELKPVPGQILLTDDEFSHVIDEALRYIPKVDTENPAQRRARGEQVVRAALKSLNERRLGSPAGELRRSPAGSLAVRVQDADGALSWEVPRLEPDDEKPDRAKGPRGITAEDIRMWPVKHEESWWRRLTKADYAAKSG